MLSMKKIAAFLLASMLTVQVMAASVSAADFSAGIENADQPAVQAHIWDTTKAKLSPTVLVNDAAADMNSVGGVFQSGDYLAYSNIQFGSGERTTLLVTLSALAEQEGKTIDIKVDAPDGDTIGTLTISPSNDTRVFQDHYVDIASVTGEHDLYFVFKEDTEATIDLFALSDYNGTETAEERDERMAWWRDAHFGQFVHWGAYAQAGGTYKDRKTGYAEWIMKYLSISKEDYARDIAKPFNPTQFDAKEIVSLAKAAGQKYMVYTSRHHEGYSMYDTKIRTFKDYGLMSYGDYDGVDPMAELARECKEQGIKFGCYITIYDWQDYTQSNYGANIIPELKEEYKMRLKGQLIELIETYDVELLWFDGEWADWWTQEDGQELYRFVRTLKPSIITNNRIGKKQPEDGDYGTPEQEIPETGFDYDWESCMTLNGSWGYNKDDHNWKNADTVITNLVDCVSKGGNYLLNVGPDEQGRVPEGSAEILREAGKWMDQYGDSIYSAQRTCFEHLPSGVKATTKEGKVYLHLLDYTPNGSVVIPKLKNEINGMKLMGTTTEVTYSEMQDDLIIDLPDVEANPYDTIIEIDVVGTPETEPSQDNVNLATSAIEVIGSNEYDGEYGAASAVDGDASTRWATLDDTRQATLELTFDSPVTVNTASIKQYSSNRNYINNFSIEYWNGTEWVAGFTNGKVDGDKTTEVSFDPITSDKIRLNMIDALNPSIFEFQLFNKNIKEISIDAPAEGVAIDHLPFTINGTAKGGTVVDVVLSGHDFSPVTFSDIPVQPDGTWSHTIDELGDIRAGKVTAKAILKNEEGHSLTLAIRPIHLRLFGDNLVLNKPVEASSHYQELTGYEGDKAVDGKLDTRWAPADGDKTPYLIVDFGKMTSFNAVSISETGWPGYRCQAFNIDYFDGSEWKTAYTGGQIGAEVSATFPTVEGTKVRLHITDSLLNHADAAANINEFQVFNTASEPTPPEPVETDKSILNRVIDRAAELKNSEEYEGAIQSVQKSFADALDEAIVIRDDIYATQQQVDNAWITLMNEIHKLGFQAGDKESLNELIRYALALDMDLYVDGEAKQAFLQALSDAQETAQDGDALAEDVLTAENALIDSLVNLRYKADKSILQEVLNHAETIETTLYTAESVEVFNAAKQAAREVNENVNATQEQVDEALDNLNAAIKGLTQLQEDAQDTAVEGDSTTTTGSASAKTGESTPLAVAAAVLTLAAAGLFFRKNRR